MVYESWGKIKGGAGFGEIVLAAGAIEAAVGGAGAADLDELSFQRLAGAMDADGGVCRGDFSGGGELGEGFLVEVDGANHLLVRGFERRQGVFDAGADDVFEFGVALDFRG